MSNWEYEDKRIVDNNQNVVFNDVNVIFNDPDVLFGGQNPETNWIFEDKEQ